MLLTSGTRVRRTYGSTTLLLYKTQAGCRKQMKSNSLVITRPMRHAVYAPWPSFDTCASQSAASSTAAAAAAASSVGRTGRTSTKPTSSIRRPLVIGAAAWRNPPQWKRASPCSIRWVVPLHCEKRNETKRNETKRHETKRNATRRLLVSFPGGSLSQACLGKS